MPSVDQTEVGLVRQYLKGDMQALFALQDFWSERNGNARKLKLLDRVWRVVSYSCRKGRWIHHHGRTENIRRVLKRLDKGLARAGLPAIYHKLGRIRHDGCTVTYTRILGDKHGEFDEFRSDMAHKLRDWYRSAHPDECE